MKKHHYFFFLIFLFSACSQTSLVDYVDPFIGTGGHGHTYPGPSMPFGMVQLSPDTRLTGWDGCSGYHYSDSIVYGFTHTHLSGTGASDYGDILLMPTVGRVQLDNGAENGPDSGYASRFSHDRESASPGYYSVRLDDYGVDVELTVTPRTGLHRYTFPGTNEANIIIDLEHRDFVLDSWIRVVSNTEVEGLRRSQAWARDQYVYFVARFSKPFRSFGISNNGDVMEGSDYGKGSHIKAWMDFDTKPGEEILVKVGISAVDVDGARKNLDQEMPDWNFEAVRMAAQQAWETELSKIRVHSGTEARLRTFYTSMYHACLNPNIYMDVDGRYRGRDLEVHQADGHDYYTLFSLWDTFRALHPLLTILEPARTADFIKTFLIQYQQGGALPVWELSANETGTMIGYHAIPVILDAYVKGIRDFDADLALEAMQHSANMDQEGLHQYKSQGFITTDEEVESVAKTLEYAYDDWCIAEMAKMMDRAQIYEAFIRRAQYYKNLFDPETLFFRGRVNGGWYAPFDPYEVNFNYTEANAWQYRFFVPQDISGLIRLFGGDEGFVDALDTLFTTNSKMTGRAQPDISGMIGQYAHGNEPSHHIAYLYPFAGQAWKTQKWVRQILDEQYTDRPDGLSGNEDAGQMSAWYIFSAMGFYPVTPGTDIYILGTPLFKEVEIRLPGGKSFIIVAKNLSADNIYIQSVALNGHDHDKAFLEHATIIQGGKLVFEMGPAPNKKWGAAENQRPVSAINDHPLVAAPYIKGGQVTFTDDLELSMLGLGDPDIYYTVDGSEPDEKALLFNDPVYIDQSTMVKARSIRQDGHTSFTVTGKYHKISSDIKIDLKSEYHSLYPAGGELALIDFIRGNRNFRSGAWQGYEGEDLEAIVDLGRVKNINQVTVGFLQDQRSWIFMPEYVAFSISTDGRNFTEVGQDTNDISADDDGTLLKDFKVQVPGIRTRYIRVFAKNRMVCPEWHPGAGGKAWIFADEILVR